MSFPFAKCMLLQSGMISALHSAFQEAVHEFSICQKHAACVGNDFRSQLCIPRSSSWIFCLLKASPRHINTVLVLVSLFFLDSYSAGSITIPYSSFFMLLCSARLCWQGKAERGEAEGGEAEGKREAQGRQCSANGRQSGTSAFRFPFSVLYSQRDFRSLNTCCFSLHSRLCIAGSCVWDFRSQACTALVRKGFCSQLCVQGFFDLFILIFFLLSWSLLRVININ
jgi:hypothetical protein